MKYICNNCKTDRTSEGFEGASSHIVTLEPCKCGNNVVMAVASTDQEHIDAASEWLWESLIEYTDQLDTEIPMVNEGYARHTGISIEEANKRIADGTIPGFDEQLYTDLTDRFYVRALHCVIEAILERRIAR
jgi:hypothetical protein